MPRAHEQEFVLLETDEQILAIAHALTTQVGARKAAELARERAELHVRADEAELWRRVAEFDRTSTKH